MLVKHSVPGPLLWTSSGHINVKDFLASKIVRIVGIVTDSQSQTHSMVGVGSDLWGSSCPTPLPKQGHLQQAAQDLVQAGLEYLQRRRLHSPSGQPVPVLRHPQSEEVLPRVQMELPRLQFVPVAQKFWDDAKDDTTGGVCPVQRV